MSQERPPADSAPDVAARMRADWEERARTGARRFINDREFEGFSFALSGCRDAFEVLGPLHERLRHDMHVVEIGCGIGRMLPFFAMLFAHVHGVDVAPGMIEQGRARLAHLPNVTLHLGDGRSLGGLADRCCDLALSFQVFQHIPDKDVIADYVADAWRVLRPGGLGKFHVKTARWEAEGPEPDTWHGVALGMSDVQGWLERHPWELLEAYDAQSPQHARPTQGWVVLRKRI